MVGDAQIVVYCFGDMHHAQLVPCFFRVFVDDLAGVCGIVPPDIVEIPHVMGLEHLEYPGAIFRVGLVAGGTHCRRR